MKKQIIYWVVLILAVPIIQSCSTTLDGDLIITKVNVINVRTGDITTNMDVVITGDSISSIIAHKNNTNYKAKQVIDGAEKYLIPGLWDMHTHTWRAYKDFFPLLIANGVTGVREMFGDLETVKYIRAEIKNGEIIGLVIISSGNIIDGNPPLWSSSDVADSAQKGREIVREQKEKGADFIKVYSFLERDTYFAIADECNKLGIPFSGHIPFKISLEEALNSGIGSMEHFFGILNHSSNIHSSLISAMKGEGNKDTLFDKRGYKTFISRMEFEYSTFDENLSKGMIDLLVKNNAWICPTMVQTKGFINWSSPNFEIDDRIYFMPEFAISGWKTEQDSVLSENDLLNYKIGKEWYKLTLSLTKQMFDDGVNFLAGSDYPNPYTYPGFSLHEELQLFVDEAKLSPLQALQTATINPAIYLKKENEFGTVETGKLANLVMLNKNPLEDIKNTTSINAVIVSGQYLDGNTLREGLEKIATKNKLPKIKEELLSIINEKGIDVAITEYHKLKSEQPDAYNFDEEQLNSLGYELLEMKKIKEAIKILELNVQEFPEYANGFDSLGDAYLATEEKLKAIEAWEKAISLGSIATESKLEALKTE
jgi:tetratricopeptide (TPR) repeat protein